MADVKTSKQKRMAAKIAAAPLVTPPAGESGSALDRRPITGFGASGRRFILHDNGRKPEVLDAIGQSLAEAPGLNVFVHADQLKRLHVVKASNTGGIRRPDGAVILRTLGPAHFTELATIAADHKKHDARMHDDKPINCPHVAANDYLDRGYFPEQRRLDGFVEAPIILPSGRLLDKPGYDSGLFLAFGDIPGYSPPAAKPTRVEAERAMDDLLESVTTFCFEDWADRAAALAAFITALLARILPARPLILVTAKAPGTGKTLLTDGFAVLATGRPASVLSLGHDDAETEKRIVGALMAGDSAINFDNMERDLGGDVPCQMTTQSTLRLRPLGTSGLLSVPTNCFMAGTGNNIGARGDMKRRVVLIRLDAKQERPEHRKFSRNHLEYIAANRGKLIRAALTITLGYFAAGEPDVDIHPMGGFELWDRMVRRPLIWLGLSDSLAGSEELRGNDPDIEAHRQFMIECISIYKQDAFTAADVVADAMETQREPVSGKSTGIAIRPALRDAVRAACRDKPGSTAMGYWLRAHRDRIIDGLRIERAGEDGTSKVTRWRVIPPPSKSTG